jgi:hypothetical protein
MSELPLRAQGVLARWSDHFAFTLSLSYFKLINLLNFLVLMFKINRALIISIPHAFTYTTQCAAHSFRRAFDPHVLHNTMLHTCLGPLSSNVRTKVAALLGHAVRYNLLNVVLFIFLIIISLIVIGITIIIIIVFMMIVIIIIKVIIVYNYYFIIIITIVLLL